MSKQSIRAAHNRNGYPASFLMDSRNFTSDSRTAVPSSALMRSEARDNHRCSTGLSVSRNAKVLSPEGVLSTKSRIELMGSAICGSSPEAASKKGNARRARRASWPARAARACSRRSFSASWYSRRAKAFITASGAGAVKDSSNRDTISAVVDRPASLAAASSLSFNSAGMRKFTCTWAVVINRRLS